MLNSLLSSLIGTNEFDLPKQQFADGMRKDSDAVLIDTRTKMEYDEGHIPDAQLIDIMDPQFRDKIDALDRDKSYYMYCRSGNRSGQACKMMLKMGFEKVYNLQSGVLDWDEPLTTE